MRQKMHKRKIEDSNLTFSQFVDMSPAEKAAYEKEHPFDYESIEEYIEDIVLGLEQFYHHSEKRAREVVLENYHFVQRNFGNHTPVDLCALDIGYGCG